MTERGPVVVGAGGHAKVVIELLRANGIEPFACVGDASADAGSCLGVPVFVGDEHLERFHAEGVASAVIAIGSNQVRVRLGRRARELGYQLPSIVSPRANVSPTAAIGEGSVVMAGATINADSSIGEFAIVNTNASVDHDCRLGDGVHVAPNVALAGNVTVGELAFVGVGATVMPGRTVGSSATVGAGALVLRDVTGDTTVAGVPAHEIAR
jgi:sugar O-acyltransferase, sialic acid O-acetyltransferase NeuD family